MKPVASTLSKVESRIGEWEKARSNAETTLNEQVRQMASLQAGLQKETASLVKALRQPAGRGRWGEVQLKRVVELAGMQEYCDFVTPTEGEHDGSPGPRRPDLVVKLPTGRLIAVDSRVPLEAYLAAVESEEESERAGNQRRHAALVAQHMAELASPAYLAQFRNPPEFVVLFFPGESFMSAALSEQPGLLEHGIEQGVILATPTTLVALLRAAAAGWHQEGIAEKARGISQAGRELYTHANALAQRVAQVGETLDATVQHYNRAVGSLEEGVLASARKLAGYDVGAPAGQSPPAPVPEIDLRLRPPRPDLSSLPLASDMNSMAATGEVPEDSFEGFTEPAAGRSSGAKARSARTRVKIKSSRKSAPIGGEEPGAEGAAGDLRAALEQQKRAG